jgi:hypothetical protein
LLAGTSLKKNPDFSQAWWCTPVIPAFRRLRQEDHGFEASLGYLVRPYLKRKKKYPDFLKNGIILERSEEAPRLLSTQ